MTSTPQLDPVTVAKRDDLVRQLLQGVTHVVVDRVDGVDVAGIHAAMERAGMEIVGGNQGSSDCLVAAFDALQNHEQGDFEGRDAALQSQPIIIFHYRPLSVEIRDSLFSSNLSGRDGGAVPAAGGIEMYRAYCDYCESCANGKRAS